MAASMTSALRRVAILLFISLLSFTIGYFTTIIDAHSPPSDDGRRLNAQDDDLGNNFPIMHIQKCYNYNFFSEACTLDNEEIHRRVQEVLSARKKRRSEPENGNTVRIEAGDSISSSFLAGSATLFKEKLMSSFDKFGVATLHSRSSDDEEALLVYNSEDARPSNHIASMNNVSAALENCDVLNVQFVHNSFPTCTIYVPALGNIPSYHIQKWMRGNDRKMQHVGSLTTPSGVNKFDLPRYHPVISKHWQGLRTFFENVDTVVQDVDAIIRKRFEWLNVEDNTVIVMTVNRGDADLLINFLCGAKARGLDVRRILVFVADKETQELIESQSNISELGVMYYHDKYNLANVAKGGENQKYGDATFISMMFAKILCVLYPSLLGYDVLYQDVDIIWYDDPLPFFHNEYQRNTTTLKQYDILFQHDGSSQPRFSPYSANSGFYYVRSSPKTQYLFISLLYHGDLVRKTTSHQQVLTQLLLEQSSMIGLKVKVLDGANIFPGGFQYNYDPSYMHSIIRGEMRPYIFHMYWTDGKETKVKFLQQFGEWYVQNECLGDAMENDRSNINCCSVEPLVSCHYRDKPSKIPCLDSPLYDKKGTSFWDVKSTNHGISLSSLV